MVKQKDTSNTCPSFYFGKLYNCTDNSTVSLTTDFYNDTHACQALITIDISKKLCQMVCEIETTTDSVMFQTGESHTITAADT